jgi:hypothetical protein
MKENELELVIVCTDCKKEFRNFSELLVFHIPEQLIKELKIPQRPHMKCPFCRSNTFIIRILKDKFGQYE